MTLVCENCGFVNNPGITICEQCGKELSLPPIVGVEAETSTIKRPQAEKGNHRVNRIGIDRRTRSGLSVFLTGLFLAWIPYVDFVGYFLLFIGLIYIFLGRKAFTAGHERNVNIALLLIIIGIIATIAIGVNLAFSVISIASSNVTLTSAVSQLTSALDNSLIALIFTTSIMGLSYVLLAYELEDRTGKLLLWMGYVLIVAIQVADYFILVPIINSIMPAATGGTQALQNAASQAQGNITTYGLLSAIPYITLGIAYYMAWKRVDSGMVSTGV